MMRSTKDLCVSTSYTKGIHSCSSQKGETKKALGGAEVLSVTYDNQQSFQEENALVTLLKNCAKQKDLYKGCRIHSLIVKWGLLEQSSLIGNTLVHMYAKCSAFAKAEEIFNELPVRDVVSWTSLIAAYAQHGRGQEALSCFEQMQGEGVFPNALTFACVLKACGSVGSVERGREIHAEIVSKGLLGKDIALGNAVMDMYAKCGAFSKAQNVFNELPARDVVSWNTLITGFCQQGKREEALNCLKQLECEGLSPDAVTFLCIVKACGSIGAAEEGLEVHGEIVRRGLLGKDNVLGNALVDMYAKWGALVKAQQVLEELPVQNVVSWTSLITGFCQFGYNKEALNCFEQLRQEGLSPNAVTFLCILKACGTLRAVEKGKEIHDEIVRKGLLGKDSVLGSALVDMYAKCGALAKAQEVFDELPIRDVVSWTALITEYCQHECGEEALKCFERMKCEGVSPDAVTFVCILKACGSIGAAEKGKEIHGETARAGLLGKVNVLASALVDMYAKCNALPKAQEVFDMLPIRDVASWTALISGYTQVGQHDNVIESFNKMVAEGVEPNLVTFIVVLTACSVLGLVDEGQMYFEIMSATYGIIPTLEHHTCMVDLFGREGHLDKAMGILKKMPSSNCLVAWFALLTACKKWENMKLGRLAFENALRLDGESAVAYTCMSDMYATAGMHAGAVKFETLL